MERKKIKIDFLDFWPDLDKENNFFTNILKKHYDVEISDKPDFLFVTYMNFWEKPYIYTEYECVRILVSWDTLYPDFNVFDYAISNWLITCGDRHLWYPYAFENIEKMRCLQSRNLEITDAIIAEKNEFCDFIYSRGNDTGGWRDKAFDALSQYKPLLSVGSYRNNDPEGKRVTMATKLEAQKKCKFSIAFEGTDEPGYISEKIFDAYRANCVPIYVGDNELVKKIINPNSYINVADYDYDFEKILEKIREIDENDELFMEMIREPVFINENILEEIYASMESFLLNIFEQTPQNAYRRMRELRPHMQEQLLNMLYRFKAKHKLLYTVFAVTEKVSKCKNIILGKRANK